MIPMENFYSGENRSIVLRLEVNAPQAGELGLGWVELSYRDTDANLPKSLVTELTVRVSTDRKVVVASRNNKVMARPSSP